jgi:hypothetical protein
VPQENVALAVEQLGRLAKEYQTNPVDGVISTCYRLIGSFERAVSDKQALQAISRETLARTLREIASKAFAAGWNSQNLTGIQRAQILDVLLSVANLAEYSFQHRLWLHWVFVLSVVLTSEPVTWDQMKTATRARMALIVTLNASRNYDDTSKSRV